MYRFFMVSIDDNHVFDYEKFKDEFEDLFFWNKEEKDESSDRFENDSGDRWPKDGYIVLECDCTDEVLQMETIIEKMKEMASELKDVMPIKGGL